MTENKTTIPPWERYTLFVEEAAIYFRIGENKLRKIISENQDADFILWNGNRPQIKRKKFEVYIDGLKAI
ncbi:MAG: excisionase [Clostridia bacterium]|nr:excisionase [Clostridia bacterium]